jgi:hypothetical protein
MRNKPIVSYEEHIDNENFVYCAFGYVILSLLFSANLAANNVGQGLPAIFSAILFIGIGFCYIVAFDSMYDSIKLKKVIYYENLRSHR